MQPAPDFLQQKSRASNYIRNGIFLIALAFGIFVYVADSDTRFSQIKDISEGAIAHIADELAHVGGDVVVEYEPPAPQPPMLVGEAMLDPSLFSAESIMVKDTETESVLFAKDEYNPHPIASITKLMSAMVLLDYGFERTGTTTAAHEEVFDTFLQKGFTYDVEDVWFASLVGSSNRGIISLIDHIGVGRDAFVAAMNEKAQTLGMLDTVFVDPTGLDAGNISNASDVVLMLRAAMQYEQIREGMYTKEYSFATVAGEHDRHVYNTNWLLLGWIPHTFYDLRGGKTGYIPDAGYNFTTQIANEVGNSIEVVIFGAASHEERFSEARDVAEWVFDNYFWET